MKRLVKLSLIVFSFNHSFASETTEFGVVACDDNGTESILQLFSPLSTNSCFDTLSTNKPTSTQSKILYSIEESNPTNPITKQLMVCNCLGEKSLNFGFLGKKTPTDITKTDEFAIVHFENLMTDFSKSAENSHNLLIIQAQMLGKDTAEKYGLNKPVSVDPTYKEFVRENVLKNIKDSTDVPFYKKLAFNDRLEKVIESVNTKEKTPVVIKAITEDKLEGETCLPFRKYLAFNTMPRDNTFWKNIKNNYNKEDWSTDSLKSQLRVEKNQEKKEYLKNQIRFLEKNPLIKLTFNSGNQAAINKVYSVIKDQLGTINKSCSLQESGCHKSFAISGKMTNFTKSISEIFNDPEMIALVQSEREKEAGKDYTRFLTKSQSSLNAKNLESYAIKNMNYSVNSCLTSLSQKYQYELAMGKQSKDSLTVDQYGPTADTYINNCVSRIEEYCSIVNQPNNSILASAHLKQEFLGNDEVVDDLYKDIYEEMNPDPSSNSNYLRDSSNICTGHHRIHGSQSTDFEGFKEQFCSKQENSEACSDKEKLIQSFMALEEDSFTNQQILYSSSSESSQDIVAAIIGSPEVRKISSSSSDKFSMGASSPFDDFVYSEPESSVVNSDLNQFSNDTVDQGGFFKDLPFQNNDSASIQPFQFNQSASTQAIKEIKDHKDSIDKEIRDTKEAIGYNQERLDREHTTPQFKSSIESRIEGLEKLLAEKEKSSQEYQQIITKLIDSQKKGQVASATGQSSSEEVEAQPKISETKSNQSRTIASLPSANNDHEDLSRNSGQMVESFSTQGGAMGGAGSAKSSSSLSGGQGAVSSSRGSSNASSTRLNSALLSKYGITIQDSNSGVHVANTVETNQVSGLLLNSTQNDLGLKVSKDDFIKFKNNDISALNSLYEQKLNMMDAQIVKLSIRADGEREALEFYAIKEDGQIVFQPVRKNKLSDLQNALQ